MSNCSNHSKSLFGQSDMKVVAEAIGDLHYETLSELILCLSEKLRNDSFSDKAKRKHKLAQQLYFASNELRTASIYIDTAWQVSKPFMDKENQTNG